MKRFESVIAWCFSRWDIINMSLFLILKCINNLIVLNGVILICSWSNQRFHFGRGFELLSWVSWWIYSELIQIWTQILKRLAHHLKVSISCHPWRHQGFMSNLRVNSYFRRQALALQCVFCSIAYFTSVKSLNFKFL